MKLAKSVIPLKVIYRCTIYSISSNPMLFLVHMTFPTFKLFSYEPDLGLVADLIFLNVMESPTIGVKPKSLPSKLDNEVYFVFELDCEKLMLKFFKDSRQTLADYLNQRFDPAEQNKQDFIFKNPQSLAAIELTTFVLKMNFKNGGSKKVLFDSKKFSFYDFRNDTILCDKFKEVISSKIAERSQFSDQESAIEEEELFPEDDFINDLDFGENDFVGQKNRAVQKSLKQLQENISEISALRKAENVNFAPSKKKTTRQRARSFDERDLALIGAEDELYQALRRDLEIKQVGAQFRKEAAKRELQEKIFKFDLGGGSRKRKKSREIVTKKKKSREKSEKPAFRRKRTATIVQPYHQINLNEIIESEEVSSAGLSFSSNDSRNEHDLNAAVEKYGRKWVVYRYDECERAHLSLEETEAFSHKSNSDLFLSMVSSQLGETHFNILLQNKTIIFVADLFLELANYVANSFVPHYDDPYRKIEFNNFSPMKVTVEANNLSIVFPDDYRGADKAETEISSSVSSSHSDHSQQQTKANKEKYCLILALNSRINLEKIGDPTQGPGCLKFSSDVLLRSLHLGCIEKIFGVHQTDHRTSKSSIPHSTTHVTKDSMRFSLIEPFKVAVKAEYKLDVYRKRVDSKYPARLKARLVLSNKNQLVNNFLLCVDQIQPIIQVAQCLANNTQTSESGKGSELSIAKPTRPEEFSFVSLMLEVHIKSFKASVYNAKQRVDLMKFELDRFILKMSQFSEKEALMRGEASISLKCFNRRSIRHEYLIEPWTMRIQYTMKNKSVTLELSSATKKNPFANPRMQDPAMENSLNINLTVPSIETTLEIVKLFNTKMVESEPYCIRNLLGQDIEISNSTGTKHRTEIKHNDFCYLPWKFFNIHPRTANFKEISNLKALVDLKALGVRNVNLEEGLTAEKRNAELDRFYLKRVDCDNIGKLVYSVESKGVGSQDAQKSMLLINSVQPAFTEFSNIGYTDQVVRSVKINMRTGMKEIVFRSLIVFQNSLTVNVTVHLTSVTRGHMDQVVEPGQKFYIPLHYDPDAAGISFSIQGFQPTQSKFLSHYIKEQSRKEDFSEEDTLSADSDSENAVHREAYFRNKDEEKVKLAPEQADRRPLSFCLLCYKRKVKSSIQKPLDKKRRSKSFSWETYLIAKPFLQVSNALPKHCAVQIDTNPVGTIEPGQIKSQYLMEDYNEDLEIGITVEGFQQSSVKKVFKRIDEKEDMALKLKAANSGDRDDDEVNSQWVHLEVHKISALCRHIVVYSPFLIINETKYPIYCRESRLAGGYITVGPYFIPELFGAKRGLDFSNLSGKSKLKDLEIAYDKQLCLKKTHSCKVGLASQKSTNSKKSGPVIDCYMYAPSKKTTQLLISLNKKDWSTPLNLHKSQGSLSVLELSGQRKKISMLHKALSTVKRYTWDVFEKITNKVLRRADRTGDKRGYYDWQGNEKKMYEFSVTTKSGVGLFSRSRLLIFSPRFAVKNETNLFIMMKQDIALDIDENRLKLRPNSWGHFDWANSVLTEAVLLSITDANFLTVNGWSGRFRIDQVE